MLPEYKFWSKVEGTNQSTGKWHFWINYVSPCKRAGKYVRPARYKKFTPPNINRICRDCRVANNL